MADTAAIPAPGAPASKALTRTPPITSTTPHPNPASPAIPVGLNEAALDSPTFRAVTVHFAEQVDSIEKWLDSYVKTTSKLVHDMLSLEESINTYLSKIVPPPPSTSTSTSGVESVLDPDYTLLALGRTADGAREWWNSILSSMRRMEGISVEPIKQFLSNDLRTFKEIRRTLEAAQKQFDSTLARYVAQSKTKEPSALREDAFQVFEARKMYIKASMDFCQLAPQLRFTLDKVLVRVCADMYREMRRSRDQTAQSMKWSEEMERIRGWSREMEASEAVFKRELQIVRRDIAESTVVMSAPSRVIEDYSASTVPYLGSKGPMNMQQKREGQQVAVVSEKQGWLWLKVVSGKPVRTNWIRRWYYCRDGCFGWLAQGPLGVVQGDEIGVLLCSVKPAVQEDRRFCFEVKTKTQTLMLQAETQPQLIEWLEVFDHAKKKAFELTMGRDDSSLPGGFDPAFAIIPASVPEFSAKSLEGITEEGMGGMERTGTLPVPGSDGMLTARTSMDVNLTAPRRSLTTALAREEGESGREHAARLMQKLDIHRKGTLSADATAPSPQIGSGSGGIASLISASNSLLPGYGVPVVAAAQTARQPTVTIPSLIVHRPGSLAPITLARSPVPTYLSKAAVTASAERGTANGGPRGVASAVIANYWGTTSWSNMHNDRPEPAGTPQVDLDDPFIQSRTTLGTEESLRSPITPITPQYPTHKKALSADARMGSSSVSLEKLNSEQFPEGYPPELKAQHAQFRLLFPSVSMDEKLVLVFNAAWTSNSAEEAKENKSFAGNGRIYVTPDNMYFYGHQMGMVVAYTINLDVITEVTAAPGRDCDYIFLHLGEGNETGLSRISIKIFLEDIGLLQARLNFLIDDIQAEEPMELGDLVSALIRLEKEDYDDKKSPSVESWEEVSANTPMDDGTTHGRPVSRRVNELNHKFRSSKSMSRRNNIAKVQLPSHPIFYEPADMGKSVAERNFEISAKACFHVLFGDKSFIFPKLYFERRAKEIAQGPWQLLQEQGGNLKRQFTFKVDYVDVLGRKKPGDVTDTQTIDVFSDHITYVVTHVKTPWHLPHSGAFNLVTKVVITHVAKSKCKLAVFTKVDWHSPPPFSKNMINRQAVNDAENDAEELAEIATDQVRKLGPHSRTKRAIQVYGNIGQQTQVVVFTPSEAELNKKDQIQPRTLTTMLFETARSFMESAITSLIMWTFAGVRKLFSIVTANRVILLLLGLSVIYNMVVVSQSTSTWWTEKRAAKFMNRLGVGPNVMMSKAIYLADLEEVSHGTSMGLTVPENSKCYSTFQSIINSTNMDAPYETSSSLPTASEGTARRLRRTRQRLGSYRHDLVVAMRIVNGVEREVIQSEWENWLADENVRCEQARSMLRESKEKERGGDMQQQQVMLEPKRRENLRRWHEEYCGSCVRDREVLMGERNSLV